MSNDTIEFKLSQFDEFFSIKYDFSINARPLNNNTISTYNDFISQMPTPFKLANDIDVLDQEALAPLGTISGLAGQLVKYLDIQSKKIDLLINHMLNEQDDINFRYQGVAFGGAGIIFLNTQAFDIGETIEVKIFLAQQNCAIFCHAEVIEVTNKNNEYTHKLLFTHIREEDRERLVRLSLQVQSKQLQQLAKERKNNLNN